MRTPFIAGNWKMNKTSSEARTLIADLVPGLCEIKGVEKVLCPPFTALFQAAELLYGTDIGLGAQNMNWEAQGAYTGEISAGMITELCKYVIIGHSERRKYFGETDELINLKIIAALAAGLVPIVCVGETEKEFEEKRTAEVVTHQIINGFKGVDQAAGRKCVVAYEPVWAIGTGRAASGDKADAVIRDYVRSPLAELFGKETALAVRVLYGGSVTAENAAEFFSCPNIDGALVGGASLKANDFIKIVKAAI